MSTESIFCRMQKNRMIEHAQRHLAHSFSRFTWISQRSRIGFKKALEIVESRTSKSQQSSEIVSQWRKRTKDFAACAKHRGPRTRGPTLPIIIFSITSITCTVKAKIHYTSFLHNKFRNINNKSVTSSVKSWRGKSPSCLLCRVVSQIPLQRLVANFLPTCYGL